MINWLDKAAEYYQCAICALANNCPNAAYQWTVLAVEARYQAISPLEIVAPF